MNYSFLEAEGMSNDYQFALEKQIGGNEIIAKHSIALEFIKVSFIYRNK